MLKIRIIAALSALVLTLITAYIVPRLVYFYSSWADSLSHTQQLGLEWGQAILGGLLAAYGFWLWRKKAQQKTDPGKQGPSKKGPPVG